MTLEWLVTIIMGAAAVVLFAASLILRRSRRAVQAHADRLQREMRVATERARVHAAGERESTWALDEAMRRVERLESLRQETDDLVENLEGRIDELTARLSTADGDISAARREADEAATEAARLEGEVSRLEGEMARLEGELVQASADAGPDELDADDEAEKAALLARADGLSADLEEARSRVGILEAEIAHLRDRPPEPPAEPEPDRQTRERLVASEAHRRDLEDRLNALHAVRAAEQRRAAEQVAIADRLHANLATREERIEALELDLKQAEESRDDAVSEAASLQVQISRLKSDLASAERRVSELEESAAALGTAHERIAELEERVRAGSSAEGELERLRKSLEAERARAERISRRTVDGVPEDATYAMWERVVRERIDGAVDRETERLRERIEHLRVVVAEKEERIRALTSGSPAAPSGPPPITAIKGIGPKIAEILAAHDVTTVADVAALTVVDVAALGKHMPVYPGRIIDDDWVGQAKAMLG